MAGISYLSVLCGLCRIETLGGLIDKLLIKDCCPCCISYIHVHSASVPPVVTQDVSHSGLCLPLAPTCLGLAMNFALACVSHLHPLALALTSTSPLHLVWPSDCLCCSVWPGHHGLPATDCREVLAQRRRAHCIAMRASCFLKGLVAAWPCLALSCLAHA